MDNRIWVEVVQIPKGIQSMMWLALTLKTTGTEMHGETLRREASLLVDWYQYYFPNFEDEISLRRRECKNPDL